MTEGLTAEALRARRKDWLTQRRKGAESKKIMGHGFSRMGTDKRKEGEMGLTIYIASSWRNQHAVEMLTRLLRECGHEVRSFVENNNGECTKRMPFDEWAESEEGRRSFKYDTNSAMNSDLVIYIGPSGTDAWAEVGAAWASGVPVMGLWAKGEPAGLMRRMVEWKRGVDHLLAGVQLWARQSMPPAAGTLRNLING